MIGLALADHRPQRILTMVQELEVVHVDCFPTVVRRHGQSFEPFAALSERSEREHVLQGQPSWPCCRSSVVELAMRLQKSFHLLRFFRRRDVPVDPRDLVHERVGNRLKFLILGVRPPHLRSHELANLGAVE